MDLTIPPPLMTSEPGSFARYTIAERKPQIIAQVLADNAYPPDIVSALDAFRAEMAGGPLTLLASPPASPSQPAARLWGERTGQGALRRGEQPPASPPGAGASDLVPGGELSEGQQPPASRPYTAARLRGGQADLAADLAFWNAEAARYAGRTWLELPWYFAETYFYRRLLEAVRYFEPGPWQGRDPFAAQKREQERQAVAGWAEIEGQLSALEPKVTFEALLHSSLWGNRADLSNYTVREQAVAGLAARGERHNLMFDDTDPAAQLLSSGVNRVDFVNDNTGRELLLDLALADFLLTHGWARRVVMHLKDRPFFVSDAMLRDVDALVELLHSGRLGAQIVKHVAGGRLVLQDESFWTTCLLFRRMPQPLAAGLARADLVILKGDVNYRRLLDDAHWPPTARVEEIAAYFPAPFLILRTLKGEIVAGLAPGQAQSIAAEDPDWLIDGKRGIIQLINRR